MKIRTVLVPAGQINYYRVGFVGDVSKFDGEYIRTERTLAIDPTRCLVTKEVIAGREYESA